MKDFVDDLYRRASENPDIPFNEEAWDKMELKLDRAARKRRAGLFWLFFFIFISLGFGLLWGIQTLGLPEQKTRKEKFEGPVAGNNSKKTNPKINDQQSEEIIKDPPTGIVNTDPNQLARLSEQDHTQKGNVNPKGNVNLPGNQTEYSQPTKPRLFANQQQGPHHRFKPQYRSGVKASDQDRVRPNSEDLAVIAKTNPGNSGTTASLQLNVYRDAEGAAIWVPLEPLPGPWGLSETQVEPIDQDASVLVPSTNFGNGNIPPKSKIKSWGIGLSAGPDLASVNANGSTARGFNAGLAMDYRIGKRWVFQASGQYLLKNYIADQHEYVAPMGFWPTRSYPVSTFGTCNMLQWSLDFRYNWLAKPKLKSYVGLGSSSWTILREEYDFTYTRNYPGLLQHWASGQNKNYWFSLAQFNLGVEKNVLPGISLQLNWFVQAPFQGVGNGKVEIYSSGLGLMVHKQLGHSKK